MNENGDRVKENGDRGKLVNVSVECERESGLSEACGKVLPD
jgi:hypothetical protein